LGFNCPSSFFWNKPETFNEIHKIEEGYLKQEILMHISKVSRESIIEILPLPGGRQGLTPRNDIATQTHRRGQGISNIFD
jgi:hypothetical protein